jgi:MFS family permease
VNLRQNQRLVVPVVYVAAMFMAIMDTTIVNVALPTLGRDFHARPDSVGLVSIAYLVSLTVFIPASGWLGDLIGGRRALLSAIALSPSPPGCADCPPASASWSRSASCKAPGER